MDPITMAAMGGTALSSIFGALAEHQKSQTNWAINETNRRDRNEERQQGIDYADMLRAEQQLGGTNAAGDRSYFKKGQGWVTDLGNRNQQLLDYFYGNELPERRAQFGRSATRSRTEDDMANQLLQQFVSVMKGDPREAEAMLYEAATRGIGENTNAAMESAMRQAIRGGSSNAGKIAGRINAAGAKARGEAGKNAKLEAMDYVDKKYNQDRGNLGQLYQMFAGRAGADLGTSYDPTGKEQSANALTGQFAQLGAQGNSIGAGALAKQGGSFDPWEGDFSLANAFGGTGAALGGGADRMGAQKSRDDTNQLLMQYISGGGNVNLGQGGIGAPQIADRVRLGSGSMF